MFSKNGPIKVLVADGHTLTRLGMTAFVENEGGLLLVGDTGDEGELIRLVQERRPDIVILDLNLTGGSDRFGICCKLKALTRAPRILVYSAYNFSDEVASCLLMADAYVGKDVCCQWLTAAIHRIGVGYARHPGEVFGGHGDVSGGLGGGARLTAKEREIATMMFSHRSNTEIAATLHLSLPTVKTHVRNVLRKLGADSRAELFARILLGVSGGRLSTGQVHPAG